MTLTRKFAPIALLFCATHVWAEDISPNIVLRNPAPTTPLTKWVAPTGSETASLELDGSTMRGWAFPAPNHQKDAPTVLFFYGAATILHDTPMFAKLAEAGVNVIVFDYRGYGFSSGVADVMAFRKDALAEYDYAAAKQHGPVILFGFSLGTAMATYVASERDVKAVALAGAIASADEEFPLLLKMQGVPATGLGTMQPSVSAKLAFGEVDLTRRSKAPLLVLHGEEDTTVPIAQGREVFAASPSINKRFVALPGVGHFDTAFSAAAQDAFRGFLKDLAGNAPHGLHPSR
jgi:pimeloyl-ACP methyl ester carboxylesterase